MLSTLNGCMCSHLSSEQRTNGTRCISCRSRETKPYKCPKCKTGVWTSEGDSDGYGGECSECYYDNSFS